MRSVAVAILLAVLATDAGAQQRSSLDSLVELFTSATAGSGSARAESWQYQFPRDHHVHESQPVEQWQLFAVTESGAGVSHALNVRLLRVSLNLPETASQSESGWAFDEVYGISSRLVDLSGPAQWSDTRLARAALGLSGNDPATARIWINQHSLQLLSDKPIRDSGKKSGEGRVRTDCVVELRLILQIAGQSIDAGFNGHQCAIPETQSPLLHGYSLPLTLTAGTLAQQALRSGQAWLLRSWGELPLAESPVVFDQFHIPLTAHSLLQVLRSRRRDGSGAPVLSAVLHGNGRQRAIDHRDLRLDDTHFRESESTGHRYSAGWTLTWPGHVAQIKPVLADQEIDLLGRAQWMGAVSVELESDGAGVAQNTSLTGFAELSPQPLVEP